VSAREIAKPKISDSKTDEMFYATPDSFEHAANLPIDSLTQHNAQVSRRDGVKSHDFGSLPVQKNSAEQFRRKRRVPLSVQRHLIFLVDFVTRVSEPLCQFAIIC
jgi:hypothetical protein